MERKNSNIIESVLLLPGAYCQRWNKSLATLAHDGIAVLRGSMHYYLSYPNPASNATHAIELIHKSLIYYIYNRSKYNWP